MTAFGRAGDDRLEWQLKAVNHRYLEVGFRLPEPLRPLEPQLRERVRARLRRGKVDAVLRLAEPAALQLDDEALAGLLRTVAAVRQRVGDTTVDVLQLLQWPGVAREDPTHVATLAACAEAKFDAALDALVEQRQREGASLAVLLRDRLSSIEACVAQARCLAAGNAEIQLERLRARLAALQTAPPAEGRLEQELALLAQKADVAEELDRLDVHVAAAADSLGGSEPCGRRLDFLLQELGREANTLAAKAVVPAAASLAVDLKVAIEQMREQVQNVE